MMNVEKKLEKEFDYLIDNINKIEIEEINDIQNFQNYLIEYAYDLLEDGMTDKAYRIFNLGTYLDNQNPDILNGLGITLCEMGKIKESKIIFERAIRLKPNDPITMGNFAGVCWESGDLERAIFYYNKSLTDSPILDDVYINLINLYLESGNLFMAFITCVNFKNSFPDSIEAAELLDEIIFNLAISFY